MNQPAIDTGIPVLTEVITSVDELQPTTSPASHFGKRPTLKEHEEAFAKQNINSWVDGEWSRLERQISERVLKQMLDRINLVLEQRVRDSLADVLQTAVSGLASEILEGLQQSLEEIIARAVTDEIENIQSGRNT